MPSKFTVTHSRIPFGAAAPPPQPRLYRDDVPGMDLQEEAVRQYHDNATFEVNVKVWNTTCTSQNVHHKMLHILAGESVRYRHGHRQHQKLPQQAQADLRATVKHIDVVMARKTSRPVEKYTECIGYLNQQRYFQSSLRIRQPPTTTATTEEENE